MKSEAYLSIKIHKTIQMYPIDQAALRIAHFIREEVAMSFKAGQEAMRERAANAIGDFYDAGYDEKTILCPKMMEAIRTLPIEQPPNAATSAQKSSSEQVA